MRRDVDNMTDSQKIDLLLEKMTSVEGKVDNLEGKMGNLEGRMDSLEGKIDSLEGRMGKVESEVGGLKHQLLKSTAELKAMDKLILDEVERVHDILNKHIADKTVHTA